MKKKILLILSILLVSGCMRIDKEMEDYSVIIDEIIKSDSLNINEVGSGFEFFVPKGLRMIKNDNNNLVFLSNGTKIYMYVDITSYYYNNKLNYDEENNEYYYYQKIKNKDNEGYILIDKEEDIYFIKMVYNYAKIEVYTNYENLNNMIAYSSMLLKNIDYKDIIIKNLLDDNSNDNGSEITYDIEKPADAKSNFSQILEEYIIEEDVEVDKKQLPDE